MASTPHTGKQQASSAKSGGGFGIAGILGGVFLAVIAVFMLPTTLLLVIGMIPTVVAYFVDTSKQRTLGPTVFYLNFAGVLPVLLKLWTQKPNINTALDLIMDPFMLLMMLAPAGFGWLLFLYIPPLVSGLMRRRAEMRINLLESDQKRLIEEWGQEVAGKQQDVKQIEKATDKVLEESFTA